MTPNGSTGSRTNQLFDLHVHADTNALRKRREPYLAGRSMISPLNSPYNRRCGVLPMVGGCALRVCCTWLGSRQGCRKASRNRRGRCAVDLNASGVASPCVDAQIAMSPTPARRVVDAFGNCEALAAMYTDDVVWRLSASLAPNIAGPHVGKDAVVAFNTAVFTKFYEPGSVVVNVLDELGDEESSVVRFDFHATSRRGHSYDVEYVLFVKSRTGKVCDVVELLETHASNDQHAGRPVGVRTRR